MSDEEIIAVVEAHRQGKEIECRPKDSNRPWETTLRNPCWNFSMLEYRVKPEAPTPREFWVVPCPGRGAIAGSAWTFNPPGGIGIHVREVLE